MPCPEGTAFNPDFKICDFDYNVAGCGCDGGCNTAPGL